ncbi:hypothetical protein [Sporolactobacillus putidus]|nr:hypothetical protein [Sporolactobacillus putidus]
MNGMWINLLGSSAFMIGALVFTSIFLWSAMKNENSKNENNKNKQ